jgi:hypothetical protein
MARTYVVTHTFSDGNYALADKVNENFSDILAAINSYNAGNLFENSVPLARIADLTTLNFTAATIDTDDTLGANSDTVLATQSATRSYINNRLAGELPDDDAFGTIVGGLSDATVYQAASDGFLVAVAVTSGLVQVWSDAANPPTVLRAIDYGVSSQAGTLTIPVRKNHYWKTDGADAIYWYPVGG